MLVFCRAMAMDTVGCPRKSIFAPIFLRMKKLGVGQIISVSAVGSLRAGDRALDIWLCPISSSIAPRSARARFRPRLSCSCESWPILLQDACGERWSISAAAGRRAGSPPRNLSVHGRAAVLDACRVPSVPELGRACDRHDQSTGSETGAGSGDLFRHAGARDRLRLLERSTLETSRSSMY